MILTLPTLLLGHNYIVLCFSLDFENTTLGIFLLIKEGKVMNCRLKFNSLETKKNCLIPNSDIFVSIVSNKPFAAANNLSFMFIYDIMY